MAQKVWVAKIVPTNGGREVWVKVLANDQVTARKVIEQQYGPVKRWVNMPQPQGFWQET